ncbi:DUF6389 family protein [Leucobacter musarum]|uniref:DUF6389 family protein n=1 Tax=Leucobacter musarum TaxID=1930747 RepID=UPI0009495954|nr:DUF6389 family protein [Leucobacter musarum]
MPPAPTPAHYPAALREVLDTMAPDAQRRLAIVADAARAAGLTEVVLDVFVDDDAEGPFDIWARFPEESVFETQHRVGDERQIIGVEWTEDGWDPDVPPSPRGWGRIELEHAVLTAVTGWIAQLLPEASADQLWTLETPDGATDPIELRAQ